MIKIAAVLVSVSLALAQTSTQTTTLDPPLGADGIYRIQLGTGDKTETIWDGSVRVSNGELTGLIGYEMRYGDLVHPPRRWEARTRKGYIVPPRPMFEQYFQPPVGLEILSPSVLVYLRTTAATSLEVETRQGAFSFAAREIEIGSSRTFLQGRVRVEHLVLPALAGRQESGQDLKKPTDNDFPSIAVSATGVTWTVWQGWDGVGDRVLAQQPGGRIHEVAGPGRDVYRTAAAFDGEGKLWVVWSERATDNWDLFARTFDGNRWSRIERLTEDPQPDAQHRLVAGPKGSLHLVWQGWRQGRAAILYREYKPGTGWTREQRISSASAGNCWEPAVAVNRDGNVFVAWDQYGSKSYDVMLRPRIQNEWRSEVPLAATERFESQVSAVADPSGRVWFAWQEAGTNWGKDSGYPRDITVPGEALYRSRQIKMAVWENGKLLEPAGQLSDALPSDPNNFYEIPELASDGAGRIWCFFRHRTNYEINVPTKVPSHYALWEIYASFYQGGRWSPPTLLPYSTGLNDLRLRTATKPSGEVVAVWPTDRRNFRDFSTLTPDVFFAGMPFVSNSGTLPRLVDLATRPADGSVVHPEEVRDVAAARGYVYKLNGKQYRIFRGDMHRHTEFSWDGYNDGSLQDAYRYAIDAAALDYLAVTDHNWGAQHPYDWWRMQKAADLYHVRTAFTPFFAYERSLEYPNGHRNIVFDHRGVRELDNQMNETTAYGNLLTGADSLFAYLRRNGGISMPHSTGTSMGTDWRDTDARVEPLVEIYQGDRNNYESEGAWRTADPNDPRTQAGGYKPDGMVSRAWEKGYRLGVQASSDHMSTHSSYGMILSESNSREQLLSAMKARHAYAATDNIIVDFRLIGDQREFLMGDDVRTATPPRFRIRLVGSDVITDVHIVKNNRIVFSSNPANREVDFEYRDTEAPGEEASYYYVRLRQGDKDRQLAWSSPIWVRR